MCHPKARTTAAEHPALQRSGNFDSGMLTGGETQEPSMQTRGISRLPNTIKWLVVSCVS